MRIKPIRNEWMKDNWTNNLFRLRDMLFGVKAHPNGDSIIQCAQSFSAQKIRGKTVVQRHFYTYEALFIHTEALVRCYIKNLFRKRAFHLVKMPALVTPMGMQFPPIFSYAIGIDVHGETDGAAGATDVTVSLTLGGSVTLLLGHTDSETLSSVFTGVKWNTSETLSLIVASDGTLEAAEIWGILSPTTGAHNLVFSRTASTVFCWGVAYTGTDVSALPSTTSSNFLTGSAAGSISASLTTPVDNCWVAGCGGNDFANGMTCNKTVRDFNNGGSSRASFDTNAVVTPAGNSTCTFTVAGIGNWAIAICAIQPPSATVPFNFSQFFPV